ncbi:RNA polymerase sigma factor [Salinibacillus xinjiangensis]|uniref:Sigma-70 family RNA polymerase sigma factor n=1 Tax=Salinibacillus xinjiangensis TaxID=1229268 RepID=A0A6G1X865_9BACI|nr:RNA polymerase sigma factor [Salinibacillus xinjiangensis]MRG87137.1 sigma-70 family RNA polymerase sigma factor [Salinibacillus xinjiangensis]
MNEKPLIKKVKKGNQKAFKELYDQYANYALATAISITKNKNDASDIVQETFIKVYRNIHAFDHKRPFKPWFYRILINETNRYMKNKTKHQSVSTVDNTIEMFTYKRNDENLIIEEALNQLEEINRTPIILKYLHDFTEKEIAEILELNLNTVKSRLFKGREKLRTILGGMTDEKKQV